MEKVDSDSMGFKENSNDRYIYLREEKSQELKKVHKNVRKILFRR